MRLDNIEAGLEAVKPLEGERIKRVKERMQKALDSLSVESNQDRFEQELIYYLEKFDVTEEKVRLKAHLDYFRELMKEGGTMKIVLPPWLGFGNQGKCVIPPNAHLTFDLELIKVGS